MDKAAKNLRYFYGVNSVQVWSAYRDIQRAERSVAVYLKVMESLKKDLKLEQERRGTLVRLRSNEVTDVRTKLSEIEVERNETLKEKRQKESRIDSFLGQMEVVIKSLFGASEGIDKIKEDVDANEKKAKKLDEKLEAVAQQLSDAIFKQNAAIDPIEDLEFALDYLDGEVDNCRERQHSCRDFIYGTTTKKCMEGGPLVLDLCFHSGVSVADEQVFTDTYLKIHEISLSICSIPTLKDLDPVGEMSELIQGGFRTGKVKVKGNVKLEGTGTHHRKVRRGKNRVWRQFAVYFNGTKSVKMSFDQKQFESDAIRNTLSGDVNFQFNRGRNSELENVSEIKDNKLNLLRSYSAQIFEQLTQK